jgi:hypothetical protein
LTLYFTSIDTFGLGNLLKSSRSSLSDSFVSRDYQSGGINLPDSDDNSSYPSSDELTLYFGSSRPGGSGDYDIWFSTRKTIDEPFGYPALAPGITSHGEDLVGSLSADGKDLYSCARVDPHRRRPEVRRATSAMRRPSTKKNEFLKTGESVSNLQTNS